MASPSLEVSTLGPIYVQHNQFPGRGDETDKVFVFKMSEVSHGSGVDLVKRMQPGGDLQTTIFLQKEILDPSPNGRQLCEPNMVPHFNLMLITF